MTLSSARSITAAVRPPRSLFVDYPLGHTAGKPFDAEDQDRILEAALGLLENASSPGELRDFEARWSAEGDDWKLPLLDPEAPDERTQRRGEPQYERPEDAVAAAEDPSCPDCIWLPAASREPSERAPSVAR